MKKGQKVRILSTNETGTVADQELMRKEGKVKRYVKVQLDKHPEQDAWYMEDQLGDVKEKMKATFTDERGRTLILDFLYDHKKGGLESIIMTASKTENIKDHIHSLHGRVVGVLMTALGWTSDNVKMKVFP